MCSRILNCFIANTENFVNFPDIFCIFNEVKRCILVFCEFLEDIKFLENRNNIFKDSSLKAFLRQSFRVFDFSNLASDSRYFESATLNVRVCEPETQAASQKLQAASLFLGATAFFCFWFFNLTLMFYSLYATLDRRNKKFSIFFDAWNSTQIVFCLYRSRFWRSVHSFRHELDFQFPLQSFVSKCWLFKID